MKKPPLSVMAAIIKLERPLVAQDEIDQDVIANRDHVEIRERSRRALGV